ncbi:hypothetical protein C8J57DRAFT_1580457 [Mycena rebaudengoi]|nr:hypothetical protein C8J57DRAFT_1580457 [Mycena rebaudengoi]
MPRLAALFFGFAAALLVVSVPAPAILEDRDLTGDITRALKSGCVTHISIAITTQPPPQPHSLTTNLVSLEFDGKYNKLSELSTGTPIFIPARNPLSYGITLDRVSVSAGVNDTVYATLDHTFTTPVVVPSEGKANSGMIPNVRLTHGAALSLRIVSLGILDLLDFNIYLRALGTPVVVAHLKQRNVPTRQFL